MTDDRRKPEQGDNQRWIQPDRIPEPTPAEPSVPDHGIFRIERDRDFEPTPPRPTPRPDP